MTPIWEGTTNILSLDVLRAMAKSEGQVLHAFHGRIQQVLDTPSLPSQLAESCQQLEKTRSELLSFITKNTDKLEYLARDLSFGLARTLAGALLLEHASWNGATESDRAGANRWLLQSHLLPESLTSANHQIKQNSLDDQALVFDGYHPNNLLSPLF